MSGISILPPREDGFVRKKWCMQECEFLVKSGLLTPGKYELIEGEIIFKSGQDRLHIAAVTQIIAVLSAIFGMRSIQCQAQIGIGVKDEFNDPEPDIAVLKGITSDYSDHEPDPAKDVLLVVEASLTTLPGDVSTKAMLYAKHGIPEYWVVSIANRELIVHRQPALQGYEQIATLNAANSVSPLSRPDNTILVSDILPLVHD